MKKLKAFNVAISDLSETDITTMFKLFSLYYANVEQNQFKQDLLKKDRVFLLKDSKSLDIKGFSTIVALNTTVNNKAVRGLFSGDTVVDKEYWGQGTLGVAFLKYLFLQKLKQPMKPLYWFLISKGYKTYLLMANNFKTHYPRFEETTPTDMKTIIDNFGDTLYGEHYHQDKGIISFSKQKAKDKDCLKEDITPISDDLKASNERIAYFAENNPGWEDGDELACIAKMTFSMPVYYQIKVMKKLFRRMLFNKKKISKGNMASPL